MRRFYCYIDETGQDTEGKIFIVSVVVPENRDGLMDFLEVVEKRSRKQRLKWGRARLENRLQYLDEIFTQKKYPVQIFYSQYANTKDYKNSTILTIAKAIHTIKNFDNDEFIILVDALNEKDQRYYGSQLRGLGIPSKKVRGVKKDENDALIRLADSVCGFVRDLREGEDSKLLSLYRKAVKFGVLVEV